MRPWSWQDQSVDDGETTIRPNQRQITIIVLKWVGIATIFGIFTFFIIFGIDFNSHVSLRNYLAPVRPESGPLLSSCFEHYIPETSLNQYYGIIPSVPVIEDNVCYDFASLLKFPVNNTKTTIFHSFWSSKITSFSENQVAALRSCIATQPTSTLYLWISSKDQFILESSKLWQAHNRIQLKIIDDNQEELIQGTPLQSSWHLQHQKQQKDLLRLATLYKFGGVWFDLDVLFVRDMTPLLAQEWLSQAHCLESKSSTTSGSRFEGSFLHFFKHSPYLCEMMSEADQQLKGTNSNLKQLKSLGPDLYARVYYRLLRHKIQTWAVLPWCFTDPSQCLTSNSLPSAFDHGDFDKDKLARVFAYHWHKTWNSSPGSIFKYLVNLHKQLVSW